MGRRSRGGIASGQKVRVTAVRDLLLQVEPAEPHPGTGSRVTRGIQAKLMRLR
jgi:hypothetical protein